MAEQKQTTPKKSKKFLFIIIFLLFITGAGGGYSFFFLQDKGPQSKENLKQVKLKMEMIHFAYKSLPDVYTILLKFNEEIEIIAAEIDRLKAIDKEFPNYKNIVVPEIKAWEGTQKELMTALGEMEKAIEKLYVAYIVNKEKGRVLINEQQETLAKNAQEALTSSNDTIQKLIDRNRIPGLMDTLKSIFGDDDDEKKEEESAGATEEKTDAGGTE